MARLTLSEQVESLQSQLASAQSQLVSAQGECKQWADENRRLNEAFDKASNRIVELLKAQEEFEKYKKENLKYEGYYKSSQKEADDLRRELEQLHMIVDAVEGAPERFAPKTEDDYGSKGKERTIATRLAGTFIALAKNFKN